MSQLCWVPNIQSELLVKNPFLNTMALTLIVATINLFIIPSSSQYTCALSNTPHACPPPLWEPTYNLTLSTICQPGNTPSYFIPPSNTPWGFVSLDWSCAKPIWTHNSTNRNLSTTESTSITGCQLIKNTSNPNTRCFSYHNMELALQSFESQRAVMSSASRAASW